MRTHTTTQPLRIFLLAICLLAAPVFNAAAETLVWTNAAGNGGVAGDMLWSSAANWTNSTGANAVPTAEDNVRFDASGTTGIGNVGATNAPGLVNNIISSSMTVTSLIYLAFNPGYHTTLLNPGVTLTIAHDPNFARELFTFRHGYTTTTNLVGYITIKGEGSLVVGDPGNPCPLANCMTRVHATSTHSNSAALATLDMAGLNSFTNALAEIKVGGAGGAQATRGRLILAKTNLLVVAYPSAGNNGFLIGNGTGTGAGFLDCYGDVQLGQVNEIRVNNMKVGGGRTTVGSMEFQTGLSNPTLTMRDSNGSGAVGTLTVGDNFDGPNSANFNNSVSTGILDLSGGSVDVLVNNLHVGRNLNTSTASRNVGGNGTVTWTAGTINATTLNIGVQAANNAGNATGTVNVWTNASLVANTLNLGGDAGAATGTGNGTLNIGYGGQVAVTNGILENGITNNGSSTINITNGTLTVGGLVRVDNLTADNVTLNLTVGPTISAANPVCDVTNFTPRTSVTLNVSGSGLTLAKYPLIKYLGSIGGGGYGVVTLGTLPANTLGYLTNNTATSSIDFVVTKAPGVRWKGNVNGNWDINITANWIDTVTGAASTYKENSYPGDPVVFDDSASGTKTVNLTTTLSPAIIVVDTTNTVAPYIFTGTGGLGGPADLYKNGPGTLELANSGGNSYAGVTVVGGGTLRVNSSLASGAVTVQAGATLGGTGVISSPVTVTSGGTLAPGNGVGTLTFNSSLTMSAGSSSVFEVDGNTLASDQVAGSGGVTYGGTLVLNIVGGNTAITDGAAIQLFNPAGNGTFAAIVPEFPAPGLHWDTSTLASDGMLRIAITPPGNLLVWTNAVGGNVSWTNAANWIRTNAAYAGGLAPNDVPTADDTVLFGNTIGFTSIFGRVNNIVDTSQTVSNYSYAAITNNGFHTTLIQPGATLTVNSAQLTANENNVTVGGSVAPNDQVYATIRGTNASFVVGVPSEINRNFGMIVTASCTNQDSSLSSHRATFDLSGLDNLAYWGGYIMVAGNGGTGAGDQPSGSLLLARTNLIVTGRSVSQSAAGTIRIGHNATGNGTGQGENLMELGQENTLCTEYLRIGGAKARNGGAIRFRTGLTSPTLKLRTWDQASRMPLLTLGDNNDTSTGVPSTGVLDLNGGILDALVETIHVGRSYTTANDTRNGSGNGLLAFSGGTLDVTTLNIGCQSANNLANCTGVVHVVNSALLVAGTINIGRDAGSSLPETGIGVLNLDGGTVSVAGNIVENDAGGGDGTSTINLTNGTLTVGGVITVDTVNVHSGNVTNTGMMTVSNLLTGAGAIYGPVTVSAGGTLAPGNGIGTLTIGNDLTTYGTFRADLNTDTLACDQVNVSGTLTYAGTLEINMSGSGTAMIPGASFQLFKAGFRSGAFDALVPATPGPGLAWDTSQLAVNGTMKITAGAPPSPTIAPVTVAGTNLVVSVPTVSGASYVLQSATNLTPTIFWVNESTNTGTGANLILNVPIQPNKPQKFLRFWVY